MNALEFTGTSADDVDGGGTPEGTSRGVKGVLGGGVYSGEKLPLDCLSACSTMAGEPLACVCVEVDPVALALVCVEVDPVAVALVCVAEVPVAAAACVCVAEEIVGTCAACAW